MIYTQKITHEMSIFTQCFSGTVSNSKTNDQKSDVLSGTAPQRVQKYIYTQNVTVCILVWFEGIPYGSTAALNLKCD